eukprot:s1587_g4.t1
MGAGDSKCNCGLCHCCGEGPLEPWRDSGGCIRMLIIALDYDYAPSAELTCTKDARTMYRMAGRAGVDDITVITDKAGVGDPSFPTRSFVLRHMRQVAKRCEEGDWFVWFWAGHGVNVPDFNGDEKDGFDQAFLCDSFMYKHDIYSISASQDNEEAEDMGEGGVLSTALRRAVRTLSVEYGNQEFSILDVFQRCKRFAARLTGEQNINLQYSGPKPSTVAWPLCFPWWTYLQKVGLMKVDIQDFAEEGPRGACREHAVKVSGIVVDIVLDGLDSEEDWTVPVAGSPAVTSPFALTPGAGVRTNGYSHLCLTHPSQPRSLHSGCLCLGAMGKVPPQTHELMLRGGFKYDAKKDKYFMKKEAEWDRQKRIDKGKKQYAVPASSVEEFHEEEEKMVDALLDRLKKKAESEGKTVGGGDDDAEAASAPTNARAYTGNKGGGKHPQHGGHSAHAKGAKGPAGKGDGTTAAAAPKGPDINQLPEAPQARAPALPKSNQEVTIVQQTEDKKLLDSLIAQLTTSGVELTPEMESLVKQYRSESVKLQGKQLHQLVAKQTQARRELSRIKEDRGAFEKMWSDYLDHLVVLVQTQVDERQVVLSKFDASEEAWRKQLTEASSQLAISTGGSRASNQGPTMEDDEEAMDQDFEQEDAQRAVQEATAARFTALMASMKEAQKQAAAQAPREGSRTPRRKKAVAVESSSESLSAQGPSLHSLHWQHSVFGEEDFVPPCLAQLLALQQEFEVRDHHGSGLFSVLEDERLSCGIHAAELYEWEPPHRDSDAEMGISDVTGEVADPDGKIPSVHMGGPEVESCFSASAVFEVPPDCPFWTRRPLSETPCTGTLYRPRTVSCLHRIRHALAMQVTFANSQAHCWLPLGRWFRGVNQVIASCVRSCLPEDFPRAHGLNPISACQDGCLSFPGYASCLLPAIVEFKDGSLSNLAPLVCPALSHVVFRTGEHVHFRSMPCGWTVNDIIADLVGTFPRLTGVRFIMQRLDHLPPTQIAIATRDDPPNTQTMPLDFRRLQGQICTLALPNGAPPEHVVNLCDQCCPVDRMPRGPYRLTVPDGGDFLRLEPSECPGFLRAVPPALLQAEPLAAEDPIAALPTESDTASMLQRTGTVVRKAQVFSSVSDLGCRASGMPADSRPYKHPVTPEISPCTPDNLRDALEPTELQRSKTADVHLCPEFLQNRQAFATPVTDFAWGRSSAAMMGTYTVFDPVRHVVVEKCQHHADLEALAALAVARAPFAVRSLQILTKPLDNLPRPQFVLAEYGRPAGERPLPWDLRPLQLQVRTTRHLPGQATDNAIRAMQQHLPPGSDLEGLWRFAFVHVSDALGPVAASLPTDLDDVQHFLVQRVPEALAQVHVMHTPIFTGGMGAREPTTTTVTNTHAVGRAPAPPALRIIIFRGEVSISQDIRAPFTLLDETIAQLLARHAQMRPFGPTASLCLARAFPPPVGYVQEVVLCIADDNTVQPYLWDSRASEGALTSQTADPATPAEFVIPSTWRNEGWTATVNGVPVCHVQRSVSPGDFYQPYHGDRAPPTVPQGHAASQHRVYGPEHGEIRVHVPERHFLTPMEFHSYMRRLDHPPHWGDITPTSIALASAAVFVSRGRKTARHTVVTPVPHHDGHYFVLLVSAAARIVGGVPAVTDRLLFPRNRFRHGDVLDPSHGHPRPPPNSSDIEEDEPPTQLLPSSQPAANAAQRPVPLPPIEEDDAVGLLQKAALPLRRSIVPTPGGRRVILSEPGALPPIPAPCSASHTSEHILRAFHSSRGSSVCATSCRLALPLLMLQRLPGHSMLIRLRRDFQTCNALPPRVVSFMRGVPTATEAPIEALQMYTDGSWLGYLASAAPVQGSAATLGEAVGSSFEPELAADVYALALAVATPVPAMLGFDNMAALDVAYGRAMQKAAGPLSQAGLALSHILRLQERMPGALHIDSHSGHPLNDLADCIAKHFALQQETACEGCQVWLSKTLPLGHDARGPILWDANNLALLWACPRCVVISARAASLCFAFVSAHALTSKASEKECREWWNELQCAIRRAPANHIPILMLDANAHFAWSPAAPDRRTAQNCNATAFAQLLQENSLAATPNMTPDGHRVNSWLGPMGRPMCLDYIACPDFLQQGIAFEGCVQPFEGQSDFDHRPVALRLCFQRAARRSKTQPRWDRKAMLTPQGKARLRAIYDALPVFPWQLDVDTHLSKINAYLRSQLSRFFPAQPHQPRSPVIQPDTWQLVQDRRDLRRELHAMHRCAAASIATTTCPVQPVPLEATADLCLVTLAQGYGQLKPNKAAGVTGLPAEAYSGDALGAARAHFPASRAPGQCGGRPRNPLQIPMALAKGFARVARDAGLNSALLFVDCRSAFYATVRQTLTGQESGQTAKFLHSLAEDLFDHPDEQLAFIARAVGPSLLQHHDVPPVVRRVICAMLDNTWFCVAGHHRHHFFQTRTGTAPGSPIADVQFQVIFTEVIRRLEVKIKEVSFQNSFPPAQKAAAQQLLAVPFPSWVDDLTVPLVAPTPEALMDVAGLAIQELDLELRKTELVPTFRGPGSVAARRQWLCTYGSEFVVQLADGAAVTVGITDAYVHLGSRLDASSSDSPDLQRRAALAREMIEPLKRLFRNSELTEAEKVHLLQSMPMARFKHGAGLWALESQKEREKFAAAYYEAPRRLFRAISGMTVRGLSNRDVATILGIATDQEMRNAELLRLAAWIFAEDMPALTALWLREDRWHIGMKIPCFIRPRINCTASSVPIRTVHRRLFAAKPAKRKKAAAAEEEEEEEPEKVTKKAKKARKQVEEEEDEDE